MRKSENISELAKALTVFHGLVKPVIRDKTVSYMDGKGRTIKYTYAELSSLIEACREALIKSELAMVQSAITEEKTLTITTMLVHTSGQFIENDFKLSVNMDNIKEVGAAITYGRRYEYGNILGIAAEDDIDSTAGDTKPNGKPVVKQPEQKTPPSSAVKPPPTKKEETADDILKRIDQDPGGEEPTKKEPGAGQVSMAQTLQKAIMGKYKGQVGIISAYILKKYNVEKFEEIDLKTQMQDILPHLNKGELSWE